MSSVRASILAAFLLLILNELVVKKNCVAEDDEYFLARSKRALTTICVEIKPNGPLEEPFYMCRGAELPGFQKMPQKQLSNTAGNNQPGNKQIPPSYVKTDDYRIPYNVRDETENNANFQSLPNQYGSSSGNDKNNNGAAETATSHPHFYVGNTGGSGSSSDINNGSPSSGYSFDEFQKQSSPASFHKPSEQYQQFHTSENNQRFQPKPQQQYHSLPQQRQFHYHQQQQNQPTTPFHQSPNNFRTSTDNESSAPVPDEFTNYDAIYFRDATRQPTQQPGFFPTYGTKHFDSYPGEFSSRSFFKNHAIYPSYGSTVYATSQHRGDATECGDDCEEPTNAAAAGVASANFDGYNSGQPIFRNGPNSPVQKPNGDTISAGYDKVSPSFSRDPYAISNVARTQPSPAVRFRTPTTVDANEVPISTSVAANHANLPNSVNIKLRPFTDGHFGTLRERPNFMHRQLQPILPAAHRYRAMIDDEVLQVPNWGFSTDELDLYRTALDAEPDILSLPPTPRTIPIEHLADPVMRAFYSSLPDVGPLPVYKPANPVIYTYLQPPKQQQPTKHASPTATAPQNSQPTSPSCTPCQAYSQNDKYNSCNPLGGCNFQPVFVALPCYNPPVFQPMMPQVQIAPYNANDNKQMRMMGPLEVTHSPTTSTPMPMLYHTETHPSSSPHIYQVVHSESVVTTPSTTPANDSNQSVESVEEIVVPKEIKSSKVSNSNISVENDFASKEAQKAVVEKPNGSNPNTTPSTATEIVTASYSITTPSSADIPDDQNTAAQSRTTFKSLFLTARRLAQLNTNSDEFDEYAQELSTPRSKRQRQASRAMSNGNGNGRRKNMSQM